ncbi:wall-associated receptor kinase 3-like [Cocos nucifera]|uniref:Wall-associated receptor kinase 3-like n=1 Tax=Cocos nucifera TaxID=13894 RepID=A0A8K0N5L1_COCNU|nr:wall-associated receptor kinase 3-like [Cocos nucifera]
MILELLLLLLAASLGTYISEAKNSSSPLTCAGIPYPFGKSGKAMKGFEISCGGINGTSPILQLGKHAYQIEDISLQGKLSIDTGVIFQSCRGDVTDGSGWIDLEGTPYTISDTESSKNALTMVGCDRTVLILGLQTILSSGCSTFCDSSIINGSCSGLGCCQASIPMGLKSFSLMRGNIDNVRTINPPVNVADTTCFQAFFVKKSSFSFSTEMLQDVMDGDQVSQARYPMVLDWSIGNETCEEAGRKKETYACKENSYCYNSTNGVGYRCNCNPGYDGNPYSNDGCKGVGLSLLLIIIGSLWLYWLSNKRKLIKMKAKFFEQNGGLFLQQQILSQGSNATLKIFSIEELEKATNNFNEKQILGHGGYGTVYKGVLPSKKVVAIKKSKLVDESQIEQFINEITILSQINHRNVVRLLGCCLETQVPLLVYEFISNRTLFHHIHGQTNDFSMPWEDRLRIAAETAGVLAYLHSTTSTPIIHRDIKATNILLDENYTAKVSDFGASRSVPLDQTHITTLVQGTLGYLDPEYFHTSQLTEKSDVYSFGVVLAELLTREIPISSTRSEDQRNLAIYFTLMFDKQHLIQLIEPQIIEEAGMEHLFVVAQLARRCLNLKGEERPTMKEVAMELEGLRSIFHKQQLAPQNLKKIEHLPGGIVLSVGCTEASNQYSLEVDMLASMDLPR